MIRPIISQLPIHIAVLVVILNNWHLGKSELNFSDPLLLFGILVLLCRSPRLSKIQFLIFSLVVVIVGLNILIASFNDHTYLVETGMTYFAKVCAYTLFILLFYGFVVDRGLIEDSLKILVFWALVTCVIGLYITAVIQTKVGLPYEFFWEFTRQDAASYTFRGSSGVIRTRSIFSEPQYYGFFLNTVLLFVFFNSEKIKISRVWTLLIVATAITTYSFSTLPITFVLILVYLLRTYKITGALSVAMTSVFLVATSGSILFSGALGATVFDRYEEIQSGGDTSANLRIFGSWEYFDPDAILFGNGIGSTPGIWNNYAYLITDFGIVPFLLVIVLTGFLIRRNYIFGLYFIYFTFTKGGYLSAFYWTLLIFFFIYSFSGDSPKNIVGVRTSSHSTKETVVK